MYLIDGTLRVIPPGASLAPSTRRYRETLREGPDFKTVLSQVNLNEEVIDA